MQEETLAPVLHVEDTDTAIAWYQRLGFVTDYEWSSGQTFTKTTVVVRRGELVLILSNREQGARSDSLIYLRVADLNQIEREFNLEATRVFGSQQLDLHDPDGNRIRVVTMNLTPRKGRLIGPS